MSSTRRRPGAGVAAIGRPTRRPPALLTAIVGGAASLVPGAPARALDGNRSAEGREGDNRVEIFENAS